MSVPSLHIESTDYLITAVYLKVLSHLYTFRMGVMVLFLNRESILSAKSLI